MTQKQLRTAQVICNNFKKLYTPESLRQSVIAYKRERSIEGQLLSNPFTIDGQTLSDVIKIGTAPSRIRNDEPYELSLPRLYFKDILRAAWNVKYEE